MVRPFHVRVSMAGVAVVTLVLGASAWVLVGRPWNHGQTSGANAAGQASTSAAVIDGSAHPELIPDSAAYRLYLLTVAIAADATDAQRARQRALLKWSGLNDQDIPSAASVLAEFRAQYNDLVKGYNESVAQADKAGQAPDLATFLSQRNALVQSVRDALKVDMSPGSMARLDAHVQREKRFMKVAKEVVQ